MASMSFFSLRLQIVFPYSRIGLTLDLKRSVKIYLSMNLNVRLIIPITWPVLQSRLSKSLARSWWSSSFSTVLRGRHTLRFSRTKIADCLANQSIVRVAGDTRVSETGHSYDIKFRTCPKLLPMLSDERHD